MAAFDALLRLLRALFGDTEPTPEPEPEPEPADVAVPTSPLTFTGNGEAFGLDVAVYQTTGLTERIGRVPEQNVVRFLGQALREAGYNYHITFGLEAVNLPDSNDTLGDFSAQRRDGQHLNVLLGDRDGGGWSFGGSGGAAAGHWTGRYAIAPAGNIDRLVELVERAPANPATPRLWINLRAASLHETGHTLGGKHADVMTDPDWQGYPENGARPSLLFNNVEAGWMDSPPP